MRLAIVTTHPIQYYAPLFKLLSNHIELKVFYTWGKQSIDKFDPGFGKTISWDIPLLDGYNYEFLENISKDPGSHHFKGIVNKNIISQIETYNPSVILVFGWAYSSHLKVLRYFKRKIPIYFRGDSTLLDNDDTSILNKIKLGLRNFFLKWVYSHINKAIYVGTANKNYFKWAGLKEEQLVFAPHAIDNKRFEIQVDDLGKKEKLNLGIKESDLIILFAGKFDIKKDPLLLLDAFISANKLNTHLIFVGNGKLEKVLKEKASTNLCIHFVNFQNQSAIPIWYSIADVFCLPSIGPGETWGLAINEAMASGKAIITTQKVGCSLDLVQNDFNGWVFQSGNFKQLENIILNLPNKSELKKMGLASKSLIKDWSLEITCDKIVKEFNFHK